jgi:hypothetical protein
MSGCTEDEVTAMVAAFGVDKATEAAAMVAMLCAKIGDAASAAAGAVEVADGAAAIGGDVDGMFMLSNAYLVFFMQVRPCMPIAASLRWLLQRGPRQCVVRVSAV